MLTQTRFRSLGMSLLLLCTLMFTFAGCSGRAAGDMAPVSGTVTYNGSPVADANIVFYPAKEGKIATGKTDAEGKFTLTTYEPGDGALVGEHTVTVIVQATVPTENIDNPDAYAAPPADGDGGGSSIPVKYANRATSDLKQTVKDGDNNFTIELKD